MVDFAVRYSCVRMPRCRFFRNVSVQEMIVKIRIRQCSILHAIIWIILFRLEQVQVMIRYGIRVIRGQTLVY